MKGKYMYQPAGQDREEFYRIQAWWATFNAALTSALDGVYKPYDADELKRAKRAARRVANSVHGSIRKAPKAVHTVLDANNNRIRLGDRVALSWRPSGLFGTVDSIDVGTSRVLLVGYLKGWHRSYCLVKI